MQKQTRCTSHLVAALTLAAGTIALAPAGHTAPTDTCLRGPGGVAPQGKHWYYRTERPSMRKCWYLAEKGQKVAQRAAARTAPQDEPDDEADTPATVASCRPRRWRKRRQRLRRTINCSTRDCCTCSRRRAAGAGDHHAHHAQCEQRESVIDDRFSATPARGEFRAQHGPARRSTSRRSCEHACRAHGRQ